MAQGLKHSNLNQNNNSQTAQVNQLIQAMAGNMLVISNMIRTSELALIILLFLAGSCEHESAKEYVTVMLEIPFSITPPQASIHLGDTLWIESIFPDTLHDFLSKKYFKVPNYDFFTRIQLIKLISNSLFETQQPAAAGAFDYYYHTGNITEFSSLGGKLNFTYDGESYAIKFGLIPKYIGIYTLIMFFKEKGTIVPIVDQFNSNQNRVYIMYRMNYLLNNGEVHYDLYFENCKTVYDHRTDLDFPRLWNAYTFEVR
jgi:hypothetical protein